MQAMSRILLVEDSAEHRSIVGDALKDICTVVPAQSMEEARDKMLAEEFDLILLKPLRIPELRARIEARLNDLRSTPAHAPPHEDRSQWLRTGNLRLCLHKPEARVDTPEGERRIELTPSELRLLIGFARRPGEILSREQLLQELWGQRAPMMSDRSIDVHICQLRKKLPPGPCRIEAVYGAGYRYTDGGREGRSNP